jgi:hypothetical protein
MDVLTGQDLSHNSSLGGEPPPPVPQPLDQLADGCLLARCLVTTKTEPSTTCFLALDSF